MDLSPAQLGTAGPYTLWEHPTRGDTDCIYVLTPSGRMLPTGFHDTCDLDAATCAEIDAAAVPIKLAPWGHGGQTV
jgi:hypothetical protein